MKTTDHSPRRSLCRVANPKLKTEFGFGGVLRRLRLAAGLNQKDLAEAGGLTQQSISRLETGRGQPSWRTVCRLVAALGVDSKAFLAEDG